MKLRKLKDVINPDSNTIHSMDAKEEAFSELIQFLDERSISLIMRDARDDGRKALKILRNHYAGDGPQWIISMWNTLTSLKKQSSEQLTYYIIKAETAATCIKDTGEHVSDSL